MLKSHVSQFYRSFILYVLHKWQNCDNAEFRLLKCLITSPNYCLKNVELTDVGIKKYGFQMKTFKHHWSNEVLLNGRLSEVQIDACVALKVAHGIIFRAGTLVFH